MTRPLEPGETLCPACSGAGEVVFQYQIADTDRPGIRRLQCRTCLGFGTLLEGTTHR